jgi:hypothetical protein
MSIGRGTSFEIMEIFILFIFGYFLRLTKFKYERSFSLKNKILFLLFLIFSIILFNNNIESRGAGNLRNITNELFYKEKEDISFSRKNF